MVQIRRADTNEYESVKAFYYELIDTMDFLEFRPGWAKNVYPDDAYLKECVETGMMHVVVEGDELIGAMVLNTKSNDSYGQCTWPHEVPEGKYMVIHALGVMPRMSRRGYAKAMVRYAQQYAKNEGMLAMRLDVLNGNVSALRLYEACGFQYVDTLSMYYEDTGWTDFLLYEYML